MGGRRFTLTRQFLDDLQDSDQEARIRSMRAALLVLHAPLDATVGIDNATRIFVAARHPKSFITLDGPTTCSIVPRTQPTPRA